MSKFNWSGAQAAALLAHEPTVVERPRCDNDNPCPACRAGVELVARDEPMRDDEAELWARADDYDRQRGRR